MISPILAPRRRTSTSSDMAPENGPSKVSRPAAAAVFNVRTGETTDADDVTPRAVGPRKRGLETTTPNYP